MKWSLRTNITVECKCCLFVFLRLSSSWGGFFPSFYMYVFTSMLRPLLTLSMVGFLFDMYIISISNPSSFFEWGGLRLWNIYFQSWKTKAICIILSYASTIIIIHNTYRVWPMRVCLYFINRFYRNKKKPLKCLPLPKVGIFEVCGFIFYMRTYIQASMYVQKNP